MNDMSMNQLRVFDAVVRHGSISLAAVTLNVSQPSVSRTIARLEEMAGGPLLTRSRAGVAVTQSGDRFHQHARRAIDHHDLALSEAKATRGQLSGDVRMAASEAIGNVLFAPLVTDFKSLHPDANIRTIAAQSFAIPAMLANGTVDVGIVSDTHPVPPGLAEPLFHEDLHLVGMPDAPAMRAEEIPFSEVADLPLVLNAMPGGFRTLIDAAFAQIGKEPRTQFEIDANLPMLSLLADGPRYAILPYSVAKVTPTVAPLAAARIVEPCLTRRLSLMVAPGLAITATLQAALAALRNVIHDKAPDVRWRLVRPETR